MDNPAYLRRQALFCLRLAQLCPDDPPLAEHLRRKAAEYHEKALIIRAELEVELDRDERDWGTRSSKRYQHLSQRATS
jgi:hypothetical protein